MLESFVLVDENGFQIDVVLLETHDEEGNEIPIPANYVPPNTEKRLFTPRWDSELGEWVESLSEFELQQKELEIIKQENQPNELELLKKENEMLAMAVMELTQFMLNGGK